MFEISASSLGDEQFGYSCEVIFPDHVFIVLQVLRKGFGYSSTVLTNCIFELNTQIVDQFTCFLDSQMVTFFIYAFGSSRHLERAFESSATWKHKDYLKMMQLRRIVMIFYLSSSLFSGNGVLLILWIRPWIIGSDYYFLSSLFLIIF